jgi:starch synthase
VADAVTWAGWVADPYAVLAGTHVYVNTWSEEGFGMAMCEAMALALPVVAIAAGNNREMVESGVTGLLVPEDDPQALAAAIVELLEKPGRAAVMGEAARHRALSLYGAERTARATLAHYERLVGNVQP